MKVKMITGIPGEGLEDRINEWLEAVPCTVHLTNTLWAERRGEADRATVLVTIWYQPSGPSN